MQLSEIVPWGRSLDEYRAMFNLTEVDLQKKILGCGDGPASFNAELTRRGGSVLSCDPIYAFTGPEILKRFKESVPTVLSQVRANRDNYVWTYHTSPESLYRHRKAVLKMFLDDYDAGRAEARYVLAELPSLPFAGRQFDLAVCSHLLFLYSGLLSFDFHLRSLLELCRVAREVRVFPLTNLRCEPSGHLSGIQQELAARKFNLEIIKSSYQLQKNGDHYLRITPPG